MSNPVRLTAKINTTDPTAALGIIVRLDNNVILDQLHITEELTVDHLFDDDNNTHVLQFEMYGKTPSHTIINSSNEILKDVLITISDVTIDEVDISRIFEENAIYKHNFNSIDPNSALTEDKFYSTMGCNGIVTLEFSTPFYLWLLERM